jgi:segregation and condensation protein B
MDHVENNEEFKTIETSLVSEDELSGQLQDLQDLQEDYELEVNYYDPNDQENKEWKDLTGLSDLSLMAVIESMIFISDGPISVKSIQKNFDDVVPLRIIHQTLEKIKDKFETQEHGIRVQEIADGFQFRTKTKYAKFLQKASKATPIVLTPATIEVLSIIAYRQPISRPVIEKIRGVDCTHIVRSLLDKKLIRISGRSEDLGKPVIYATTIEFLEHFNLKSVEDLPPERELNELVSKSEVGEISSIKEILGTSSRDFATNYEELDQITNMVKNISIDTDFTKELGRMHKLKKVTKDEKNQSLDKQQETSDEIVTNEKPKSAFDLLEDFLVEGQIKKCNQQSSESETLTTVADYSIKKLEEINHSEEMSLQTNLNCAMNNEEDDEEKTFEDEIDQAINNAKISDDFFEDSIDSNI